MSDYPFDVVVGKAVPHILEGHAVYQKFTCQHCGSRQAMEEPNLFFITGTCEACGGITDIKERGCNYMLHIKGANNGP